MADQMARIADYLGAHHVFTLCTAKDGVPWAASCFYVFDPSAMTLYFLSSDETRHAAEIHANANVAGTVAAEETEVGQIRGIQFTGMASRLSGPAEELARRQYYAKFPFARLMDAPIWAVALDYVKMTDNRFGFGKKFIWRAAPA